MMEMQKLKKLKLKKQKKEEDDDDYDNRYFIFHGPQGKRRISYNDLQKTYTNQMREFTADFKAMFTNMKSQQASMAFAELAGMVWGGNYEINDTDNFFLPVSTVRDGASTEKNWNTKRGLRGVKKRTETTLSVGEVRHLLTESSADLLPDPG